MRGNIFDCSDIKQADVFINTVREIAEFVGRTYKYGGDIKVTLENLKDVEMEEPDEPQDINNIGREMCARWR